MIFKLLLLGVSSTVLASATPPKTPKPSDYRQIMAKKPFGSLKATILPLRKKSSQVKRVDYDLKGMTMTPTGWLVVLVDKRSPKRSIILHQSKPNDKGLKIKGVNQKSDLTKSTVTLLVNNKPQTIGFNMAAISKSRASRNKVVKPISKKQKPKRNR